MPRRDCTAYSITDWLEAGQPHGIRRSRHDSGAIVLMNRGPGEDNSEAKMKQLSAVLCLVIILVVATPPSVRAQKASESSRATAAFVYDVSEEVAITGTVSSVLAKPVPGMIVGAHLLVETLSGRVDASLGRFGLIGNGAVPVAVGQQIEATGIMRMMNEKPIFMVRNVRVGSDVYTVRNKHGFPVSPQARKRAGESAGRKEGSL